MIFNPLCPVNDPCCRQYSDEYKCKSFKAFKACMEDLENIVAEMKAAIKAYEELMKPEDKQLINDFIKECSQRDIAVAVFLATKDNDLAHYRIASNVVDEHQDQFIKEFFDEN